ncbi:MAG: hypothetical protein D6812_02480, partial [Deltaproteobacteria bacterium]
MTDYPGSATLPEGVLGGGYAIMRRRGDRLCLHEFQDCENRPNRGKESRMKTRTLTLLNASILTEYGTYRFERMTL